MKEVFVKDNLRLIQVFLSTSKTPGPGIYEVSTDDDGNLYCTCTDYTRRRNCKHTSFVSKRIEHNNGTYPLEILSSAPKDEAEKARTSNKDYREFIIKYGKIEVF